MFSKSIFPCHLGLTKGYWTVSLGHIYMLKTEWNSIPRCYIIWNWLGFSVFLCMWITLMLSSSMLNLWNFRIFFFASAVFFFLFVLFSFSSLRSYRGRSILQACFYQNEQTNREKWQKHDTCTLNTFKCVWALSESGCVCSAFYCVQFSSPLIAYNLSRNKRKWTTLRLV